MNEKKDPRPAFHKRLPVLVRVTPKGFLIDDNPFERLEGRVSKTQLIRKLFEDHFLVCDSPDGTVARNGTICAQCLHPRCRPQLRIHLAQGSVSYVIDLAITSANNYFLLEDQARSQGARIDDWTLALSVVERDYWGEVRFERV